MVSINSFSVKKTKFYHILIWSNKIYVRLTKLKWWMIAQNVAHKVDL